MNCRADPLAEGSVVEPAEHAIERSRGGLITKLHMLTDGRARPLVLVLTAGNVNDTVLFAQLIDAIRVQKFSSTASSSGLDQAAVCSGCRC